MRQATEFIYTPPVPGDTSVINSFCLLTKTTYALVSEALQVAEERPVTFIREERLIHGSNDGLRALKILYYPSVFHFNASDPNPNPPPNPHPNPNPNPHPNPNPKTVQTLNTPLALLSPAKCSTPIEPSPPTNRLVIPNIYPDTDVPPQASLLL